MTENASAPAGFEDLVAANRDYAATFDMSGFDGIARAGVAIVTCMDSRIDPLGLVGLKPGDAKIFRNPGGRVDSEALEALVLATHLLGVERILVVPHTRCAMASKASAESSQTTEGSIASTDAMRTPGAKNAPSPTRPPAPITPICTLSLASDLNTRSRPDSTK